MSQRDLSEHFTYDEFTATQHNDLQDENRAEGLMHLADLTATAQVAEQVRALFGGPLVIHCAFRCKRLNDAVGSQDHSQHLVGQAFDFHVQDLGADDTHLRAALHTIAGSGIKFHQLLIERGCLHLGTFKPGAPNGEVAWWDKGTKVIYTAAA